VKRFVAQRLSDPDGIVDDVVMHTTLGLRGIADRLVVVADAPLDEEDLGRLRDVADDVVVLPRTGGPRPTTVSALAGEPLEAYDEVVIVDGRVIGPVFDLAETFSRMEAEPVDFWGMTSRRSTDPGVESTQLQPSFIVARRSLTSTPDWVAFWAGPEAASGSGHAPESLTSAFVARGFTWAAAWPVENYPTPNPAFDSAHLLLRDRCPVVALDLFTHESSELEQSAVLGRRVLTALEGTPYPLPALWKTLSRRAEPRHVYTNLSLLEVLPDHAPAAGAPTDLRIGVLAHVYYDDMIPWMMQRIGNIPVPYALHVTTDTAAKKASIERQLEDHDISTVDVRVVASNRGRDTSALLIGQRDLLLSDAYDVVCRVHSKKSPQDSVNVSGLFRDHLYDNLLHSPGYVAQVLRLFADHPTLGMAFPPVVNIGYPTLGHAWFANRAPAEDLAATLGIGTRFDATTPLAAYGSMFWARPESLRTLVEHPWHWDDFPGDGGYHDGSLTHVLERLLAYAALDAGYHVRSVINQDWASINYSFLEYKLERVSSVLPAGTQEQLRYVREALAPVPVGARQAIKDSLSHRFPQLVRLAGAVRRRP